MNLNRGLYTKYMEYYGINQTAYVAVVKARLKKEQNDMYSTQKQLVKKTLQLPDYASYADYSTTRNVNVESPVNTSYSLNSTLSVSETVIQFCSAVFSILNYDITYNFMNDSNVLFVINNGYNELLFGILNSANFYADVSSRCVK